MYRSLEHLVSLLAAVLVVLCAPGCDDTATSTRDVNAETTDTDSSVSDIVDVQAIDTTVDVEAGRDATSDQFDVPIPEIATCALSADVLIVVSPDVFVPLDVYETCRTVFPIGAGAPCTPETIESCTCIDGLSGTRTCRDDMYWGSCRCGAPDAGMDATPGSDGAIPRITLPRLIAPQSGSRATSQRPTFRWVLPEGVTRARVEVCGDRPCARMLMQQEVTGTLWRPAERLLPGVAFWRVRGLGADGSVIWTSATWEVGIRHRDLPNDTSYGALHDFNGDGYDDVVIYSAPWRFEYLLRVYPGSNSGLHVDQYRGMNPPYPPDVSVFDTAYFGRVFDVGDVNGDGLADLTLGDSAYGPPEIAQQGRVFVYLGTRDGIVPECAQGLLPPQVGGVTAYGENVSVGDFNGDGFADTAVLCNATDALQLHLGGPSGTEYIPIDSERGSYSNAQFVGDVNGDGYADIAVRTFDSDDPTQTHVVVHYGNPVARLSSYAQQTLRGRYLFDNYGYTMEWGDYNSDGYADAVITGAGYADVYHGSGEGLVLATRVITPPATSMGLTADIAFAAHVSASGDIDGDGRPEFAIGAVAAPLDHGNGGMVFVYQTVAGRIPELWSHVLGPVTAANEFGVVAIPGDLNGDGFDDLLVGAPASSGHASPEVYVYHGQAGEWWCAPSLVIRGSASLGSFIQ